MTVVKTHRNQPTRLGSLFEIWQSGVEMPFLVECPLSGQKLAVTSYYWTKGFFEGEMNGVRIALTGNWSEWTLIREV